LFLEISFLKLLLLLLLLLQALEELRSFMIVNGVALKEKQKLLRSLRVSHFSLQIADKQHNLPTFTWGVVFKRGLFLSPVVRGKL